MKKQLLLLALTAFTLSELNAQGFALSSTNWPIPLGGQKYNSIDQGFYTPSDFNVSYEDEGSQIWDYIDLNGDGKQDLVVTSQIQSSQLKVFGGTSPYWKVYLNTGSGFALSAINWPIPLGGQKYNSIDQGFYASADGNISYEDEGSQMWSCMDINADGKQDLVVTSQIQSSQLKVFGGTSPYWKVYLNTGSGFALSATNWPIPLGGQKYNSIDQGFYITSDFSISYEDEGSQVWSCMDINADGKQDLVVTSQIQSSQLKVFGGTSPYWKVYLNTGSGFALSATNWTIPLGGQKYNSIDQGFYASADGNISYEDEGSQMWSCMDINADGKQDLVVTSQIQSSQLKVFGGTSPYWKIYLNTGSGFALSATNWTIPLGGQKYNSIDQGFYITSDFSISYEDEGSQVWSCMDINADGKQDLVVTSQIQSSQLKVFGGTSPYWRVYTNTGSGFALSANNWTIPLGGQKYNSIDQGFYAIADGNISYEDEGSQMWNCLDINGDGAQDLVVTSQIQSAQLKTFGGISPYWKVYLSSVVTTGIESKKADNDILSIYPNPFNNKITVKSSEKISIQIFNTLGAIVHSENMISDKLEINLSELPKGVYFIKVGDNTRKIIKE